MPARWMATADQGNINMWTAQSGITQFSCDNFARTGTKSFKSNIGQQIWKAGLPVAIPGMPESRSLALTTRLQLPSWKAPRNTSP